MNDAHSSSLRKILTVVGARPQFVKAAVLSASLRKRPGLLEVMVHTGQHFDDNMSEVFFRELQIPPLRYNLGISQGSHGVQTGRMLGALEEVLQGEKPDWVLVFGDTNSTLAGALAAAKLNLPVAHVEAGLRSFNRAMPEEINRVLTDHLASLLFAPTEAAVRHLQNEGITGEKIACVGDVMYDASLIFRQSAQQSAPRLKSLGVESGEYVLATIHRAENTDDPERLRELFAALADVAQSLPVLLPLHPRTRKALAQLGWRNPLPERLLLAEPQGFLAMQSLEAQARLIVTDSGGVQKEAFFHRVPCVTLRTETEWVELVECGWNRLVPPTTGPAMAAAIRKSLQAARPQEPATDLYGGGRAADRIASVLEGWTPKGGK